MLAAYEGTDSESMGSRERLLAKVLFTVPFKALDSNLSLGLVWANKPEFLQELDFDSELSAQAALVFKWGDSSKLLQKGSG